MKKALIICVTLLAAIKSVAQTPCTYSIGSIGPAGGYIFYDKGYNSNGWRYLEAAPNHIGGIPWGCFGTFTNLTADSIGSGENNTVAIAQACGPNNAAQQCLNYTFNGYSDWFLPSIDELIAMFTNLWANGIGNFDAPNGQYWSSSDFSSQGAKIVTIANSSPPNFETTDDNKNWSDYVIPCRKVFSDCENVNANHNPFPQAISYQAIARNSQGQPLSDAAVQVRFTLLTDSLTGAAEYSESHSLNTNSLGLFTTAFGAGTPETGTFAAINWASGIKYLKVELDAGAGFVDMGTQQLLSVPYSMRSNTSAKAGTIENAGLSVYANNAAALAGGLIAGQMYRTATGDLKIVY
jgi:hypothetical protein